MYIYIYVSVHIINIIVHVHVLWLYMVTTTVLVIIITIIIHIVSLHEGGVDVVARAERLGLSRLSIQVNSNTQLEIVLDK